MELPILYKILIHKYISRRHKGTENTKEDIEFVHLSLFLRVLCELRASVRDKKRKIFTITDYEYKGEVDV